jgi:methionine-gamma-lyase
MAGGSNRRRGFQTRAIHLGYEPSESQGAVAPPVYMTSTYAFSDVSEADAIVSGERPGYIYGRETNPTQALLESRLASLEGGEAAVVFASGIGAIGTLYLTLLSAGDEIVVHPTFYSNTLALTGELARFGIKVIKADLRDGKLLAATLTAKTKLVYLETPINPTAEVLDIAAIARVAHERGAKVVVDSTFASPAVQRPLEHGADIVVHSLTKYINGHGDLLGGAVIGDAATIGRIRGQGLRYITGATLAPMSCFLVLRGLKTLKLRMRHHAENALAIARFLAGHPAVARVRYPFLEATGDHAVAVRQMESGSGMLSLELNGGFDAARAFMDKLEIIQRAVSLGDTDTLIMHPGSMLQARRKVVPSAQLADGVSMSMMRLSVGLEDIEDLIDDLAGALG